MYFWRPVRAPIQRSQGLLCAGAAGRSTGSSGQRPKEPSVFSPGRRGLRFIQVFLQSICDGERDENHPNLIRVNATKAYEMALKKYHGWIVQKIFQVSREGPFCPQAGGSPACGVHFPLCCSLAVAVWSLHCPLGSGRAPLSLGRGGCWRTEGPSTSTCPASGAATEGAALGSPRCSVEAPRPRGPWEKPWLDSEDLRGMVGWHDWPLRFSLDPHHGRGEGRAEPSGASAERKPGHGTLGGLDSWGNIGHCSWKQAPTPALLLEGSQGRPAWRPSWEIFGGPQGAPHHHWPPCLSQPLHPTQPVVAAPPAAPSACLASLP